MADYDWIKGALYDRRLSVVSRRTGLSVPTLRAVRDGTGNPTLATLTLISAYLRGTGEK